MYVAVVTLILGEALFFGNVGILEYGIALWAGFYLFVLIYEEPTLWNTYGLEYQEFCANCPKVDSTSATVGAQPGTEALVQ